jgi:hypothetical protein
MGGSKNSENWILPMADEVFCKCGLKLDQFSDPEYDCCVQHCCGLSSCDGHEYCNGECKIAKQKQID